MWQHGVPLSDGRRKVAVNAIRLDQSRMTEGNEEWNWRTLLLMQRAGLIRIDLEEPVPPPCQPSSTTDEYHQQLKDYYDQYYKGVIVTPLRDDHLDANLWQTATQQRRDYEKREQGGGLEILLDWLRDPTAKALCNSLTSYYSLDGVQPEFACGGCPHCLSHRAFMEFPTVGKTVHTDAPPAMQWRRPLKGKRMHCHVYFPATGVTQTRLLRSWRAWLLRLIESRSIEAISAKAAVLERLASEFGGATSAFWIGDVLDDASDETKYWPQVVIQLEPTGPVPGLGWPESTKILIAPEEAVDPRNPFRRWWESVPGSMSLDNFLLGLNYGAD
jgi:ATP-dependent DNA helicase RecQ